MDVPTLYALLTSAYLTLQSAPLLFTPRLITSLLTTTPTPQATTSLETYLCRTLALTLLTLAASNLILTGVLPSTKPSEDDAGEKKNPYATPTNVISTTYHFLTAFYLYTQTFTPSTGLTFGFGAGMVISSGFFCVGIWVLLFGDEKERISKSTGADKRTGNFPFENKESGREKKKERKGKSSSLKFR